MDSTGIGLQNRWPAAVAGLCCLKAQLGLYRENADLDQYPISILASVAIAVCYVMPFWLYFGDPLANMHTYQSLDWSGALVSWPFLAILAGSRHAPITN